jgi:hypothetical protein
MESASEMRSVPGGDFTNNEPDHQGLDRLLRTLLQIYVVSDPATPERHTDQVGNEEVQEVAWSSHQGSLLAGTISQTATAVVSALAVWRATSGWMMGAV